MGTRITQNSFTGGELSPSLHSRVDLQKYDFGVKKMLNFFSETHGGCSNRTGTEFITPVKDDTQIQRLFDFKFSVEQTYSLEFGDQYMRVIRDGAPVLNSTAETITGAT